MLELTFPLQRVFLALPLEQQAKWQFQALQEELKPYEDILRFQNPQTPHITLQYWSEIMEIEYGQITEQAQKVAAGSGSFILHSTGVSLFESRGEARVLFLDIAFSEELARLKKRCPWPSDRPFSPHITLARIAHPQKFAVRRKQILKALEGVSLEIPIDRLRLFAEVEGRKQTPIQDYLFP